MRLGASGYSNAKLHTVQPILWVENIKILGVTFVADTENLIKLNTVDLVKKIDMLIQSWQNRSLTPLGKIVIINTLMISTFVYKLLMIYTLAHWRIWGGACRMHAPPPPLRDQILSFSHTFLPKSTHV